MNLEAERPADARAAYVRALARYLAGEGESALTEAYALGRQALVEGLSLLDWAAVHHGGLAALRVLSLGDEALERAATFFAESLSPFEMAQRGYAETNRRLGKLNAELRREVNEKARLADQLADSNAELEAFSYSVAHDLRAPLRRASAFSQLLVEDLGGSLPEQAHHHLERICFGLSRMTQLTEGLLKLARTARVEPSRQTVDLAARARAVVEALRQGEPQRRVEVVIATPLSASADPALVDVVLENLIGNAWKFTGRRPVARIEIGAQPGSPPVYFVRDDGAGFDMATASKLFTPFQRLHPDDAFGGTGIGLATVARIVRRHGGRIWAEAEVGRGAAFYFTLVGAPPRPTAPAPPSHPRAS